MKNLTIVLLSIFILQSCGKNRLPKGVLSEDKMVEILVDIHVAEGLVSSFPIHYDSSRILYPYLEMEVFKKHSVPDSVFKNSLEYYMRDVKAMDRMYSRAIDSLHVIEKSSNE